MNIDEVHRLAVDAVGLERAVAVSAEMLSASATEDDAQLLVDLGHRARVRELLWGARLPDTHYINTGRTPTLAVPTDEFAPPTDGEGLRARLSQLADLYRRTMPQVDRAFDPGTHELVTRSSAETGDDLAALLERR